MKPHYWQAFIQGCGIGMLLAGLAQAAIFLYYENLWAMILFVVIAIIGFSIAERWSIQ